MSGLHGKRTGGCCGTACLTGTASFNRRQFMAGMGVAAAGTLGLGFSRGGRWGNIDRFSPVRVPLRVQPVLVYGLSQRREATSWRPWGGLHSESDVREEIGRITRESEILQGMADFPVQVLPTVGVKSVEEAQKVVQGNFDVTLMYASGGWVDTLEALVAPDKWTLMFLRHKSGPVSLWYEIVSNRFLRKTVDEFGQPGMTTRDVVVDRVEEVAWRLRALSGLKNTHGKKILCIGGASGWGVGGQNAPQLTRDRFGMELVDISYDELGRRLVAADEDAELVARCRDEAQKLIKSENVALETQAQFVEKAFLLTEVFHSLLAEHQTDAITINLCMGTIMEVSGTTACLPLSLLNDAGYLAFCESDFVVIPSGVLLHYISGKPVFFNDPTYPHDGLVTLAHCTAPRRMDAESLEPVKLLTHFESDWGVSPKVEMQLGQRITVVDPDFNFKRWMGFEAEIVENPFLDICRSQIDVAFQCDTDRMNEETRGFHWMACYGEYLKETEYAVKKAGLDWLSV